MEFWARARMEEDGGITIPEAMLEAVGIGEGDKVDLRVKDSELRVSSIKTRIQRRKSQDE